MAYENDLEFLHVASLAKFSPEQMAVMKRAVDDIARLTRLPEGVIKGTILHASMLSRGGPLTGHELQFQKPNGAEFVSRSGVPMRIADLCRTAYEASRANGWHDAPRNEGEMIALMHSEVSEAMDAYMRPLPGGSLLPSEKVPGISALEEEIADTFIRLGDYAGMKGLRIGGALVMMDRGGNMRLNDLCRLAEDDMRRERGDKPVPTDHEMFALIHLDLSNVLEQLRKPNPDGSAKGSEDVPGFTALEVAVAKVFLRLGAYCSMNGFQIEDAISAKLAVNRKRGYKHGGKQF